MQEFLGGLSSQSDQKFFTRGTPPPEPPLEITPGFSPNTKWLEFHLYNAEIVSRVLDMRNLGLTLVSSNDNRDNYLRLL